MATNYNSFVYDQKENTQKPKKITPVSFTFGIFFDGTQNNKYNVNARITKDHTMEANLKTPNTHLS